ncbi:MAG: hypothetical protein ACP5E4_04500 [Candidatus Aenigmatarchaeota archaeon]
MADFEESDASAKDDFEKVWKETAAPLTGRGDFEFPKRKGKERPLMKYVFDIRKALLEMGFDEVIPPRFTRPRRS